MTPAIPSTASQPAARAYKHLARPYEELAQSLQNPDAIHDCLRTHDAIFTEDKNLGLVIQALERREMQRIVALKEIYVAISLEDVARKVYNLKSNDPFPEDVQRIESLIVRMVSVSPSIINLFRSTRAT
jgi:hypothetical protein